MSSLPSIECHLCLSLHLLVVVSDLTASVVCLLAPAATTELSVRTGPSWHTVRLCLAMLLSVADLHGDLPQPDGTHDAVCMDSPRRAMSRLKHSRTTRNAWKMTTT